MRKIASFELHAPAFVREAIAFFASLTPTAAPSKEASPAREAIAFFASLTPTAAPDSDDATARASFALYNDHDDVEAFGRPLHDSLKLFR